VSGFARRSAFQGQILSRRRCEWRLSEQSTKCGIDGRRGREDLRQIRRRRAARYLHQLPSASA
jgi:hypothetical protein